MFVADGYIINYTKEMKILRFSTCQNIASKERNRQPKINRKNDFFFFFFFLHTPKTLGPKIIKGVNNINTNTT